MDFSALDFKKVTDFARKGLDKARQYAEGLNELEIKVEEATNSDRWGPHGTLMQEITKRSFNMEEYKQILGILARRLHSEPSTWRQVYKSLLLLEYMAKNGPQRLVPELKSNGRVFTRLQKFEYVDEDGKDQGLNVRNRAKELWNLVHDDALIASEREKAAANRTKYSGFDQTSSMFQSMPSRPSASSTAAPFATAPPRRNGGAGDSSSSAKADAEVATEVKLADLGLGDDAAPATAGRMPPAKQSKQKLKLSQISADNSIAGSIAVIASKAPAPAPKAAPAAADDGGLNLLDFGDDELPAPAAPASSDPMALLDELADPVAPPTAAAGDEDWADFASTEPAAASTAAAGRVGADQGDWEPFASAAQPDAGNNGDAWADFASAPAVGAPSADSADPFGVPAGNSAATPGAPSGLVGAVPSTGGRQALPLDAFTAPAVEPIPVATSPVVGKPPEVSESVAPVAAVKVAEKDPFADLLG